jgi:hypothetical protein
MAIIFLMELFCELIFNRDAQSSSGPDSFGYKRVDPQESHFAVHVIAVPRTTRRTINGDYQQIAACVYQAFDKDYPGNIRLTDLKAKNSAIVTFESPIAGGAIRDFEATFSARPEGGTVADVKDRKTIVGTPGYNASKVIPYAEICAAAAQPAPGPSKRKL